MRACLSPPGRSYPLQIVFGSEDAQGNSIKPLKKINSPALPRVEKSILLILSRNLGELIFSELNLLRTIVLVDVLVVSTLGNHDSAPLLSPGEHRLCNGGVLALGELGPEGIVQNAGDVGVVCGVCVGEGRVGDDLDVLLRVEVDKGLLLQVGVCFKLVRVGADGGDLEDFLDILGGEVGDADVARQVCLHELFHGLPGVDD
ncbi:hypothetical protein HG530_012370 [Fusarium avenaceum]|nr:hypothetical protein HG530_012370 [Fusarium avenaceum]